VGTMQTRGASSLRRNLKKGHRLFVLATLLFSMVVWGTVKSQDPIETIRIESDLVELNVSVLRASSYGVTPSLEQKDFIVLEDGTPQDISFFAASDAPFDLVLLLDLSGSNAKKLKMIRNSAKRFVDSARPVDRIALVSFTDRPALYSSFSLDRKQLKKSIDDMDEAIGGTNFWDALNYVLKDVVPDRSGNRRSAVVAMTDGVDNALPNVAGPGSRITFDDLLNNIRDSESIVFPIYLDTEEESVKHFRTPRSAYILAREQLGQIASACGTTLYRAAQLSDLDLVYARVIRDLSTVYSIGYRSSNRTLDGKWRSVEVKLPGKPELLARTKRGYLTQLRTEAR
jgi:Ca-activated chloride channel homolog